LRSHALNDVVNAATAGTDGLGNVIGLECRDPGPRTEHLVVHDDRLRG
jgi:hypothetical protein